jgi:hypothetical protein
LGAAGDYRKVLAARGITVSMSRKGDCWELAQETVLVRTPSVEDPLGRLHLASH